MLIFFSLYIDLSTALHGSEGFQCVSQIPVKLTLIYPVIWLFIVALFFPVGLDVTHGFMLAFSNTACAAGLIARWSARSLLWDLESWQSRLRVIPVSASGNWNSLMLGIKCSDVFLRSLNLFHFHVDRDIRQLLENLSLLSVLQQESFPFNYWGVNKAL